MSIYLKNISNQLVVLTVIVLDRFSFFSFFLKLMCVRERDRVVCGCESGCGCSRGGREQGVC